jgi:catechol 2,3-dioxygenase-like lactoylglutathione lyase family enzyme
MQHADMSENSRNTVLKDAEAVATIAVRDTAKAAEFYEGKMGLVKGYSPEKSILVYNAGSTTLIVYPSQFAGTNQATTVTWPVADVDGEVRALKDKGVTFEHYDMPNMKLEGDVHVGPTNRAAWFKDPDGNIHAVVNKR